MKDTIDVRTGEELDIVKLEAFIQQHKPALGRLRTYEQFGAGASNLTYALTFEGGEYVLRRPPLGPVAPKAHDMAREYTILSMLQPHLKQVPTPLLYCEDTAVLGAPFFLMERKRGIVLDTKMDGTYDEPLGQRISELMLDLLVSLHAIDYKETALYEMTKAEGFLERQVHGWIARYDKAKTDDIKVVEELTLWLKNHIPDSSDATIIHYDFKLNNVMFNDDFSDIIGLFDWEMTTVGDPLADLGVMMSYWVTEQDEDTLKYMLGKPPVTVLPGFYTREEMIARYAEKSGRDVSAMPYYITFAYFKLAVIGQQIYARYCHGQTQDARFEQFGQLVKNLMQHALAQTK